MRRNAESLLVLSGDEPPRRWGRPVPLSEVVRAAATEIAAYQRVEVLVADHLDLAGRAVRDVTHLLAELVENATSYSPPQSDMRVRSRRSRGDGSTFIVSVEDIGIGMSDADLDRVNQMLAEPPELDLGRTSTLGFHVVARLARRHGVSVRLVATPGGGVTALVGLPNGLASERSAHDPVPTVAAAGAGAIECVGAVGRHDAQPADAVVAVAVGAVPSAGGAPQPPVGGRDPERVRAMLSRFQAAQRAGRASVVWSVSGAKEDG